MYQYPTHHRPHGRTSYFMPFLSLIILGLIVVLVFQIVDYFQEKRVKALENKAALHVVAGRGEIKFFGVDQWAPALEGSLLHEGDVLRSSPGSRLVLTLLNGSVVRLSAETEVELDELKSRDGQDQLAINLAKGEVWLKRSEKEVVRTAFTVSTPNLDTESVGTTFDVANTLRQAVRVLNGKVKVSVKVLESDSKRPRRVETLEVALGQEVSLGSEELLDLQNNRPVEFLTLLSDDFRNGDWYAWNKGEDASGSAGVSVADAVAQQKENPLPSMQQPEQEVMQVNEELTAPVVLLPKEADRIVKTGEALISGTVGRQTEKIEVTTYIAGKAEPYFLKKYKAGDANWSYSASSSYGNLSAGENRFTIVAVGKDEARSEPAEVVIIYDKPKEPADLSAPSVTKFNDTDAATPSFEAAEDVVKIDGKIGKGIVKIFVDDFALTRYVPDSGVWSYYAKTAYGNLKEGENTYSVYGVDYDGNKTPVVKFTIVKKPKPAPAPVAPPAGEPVL
ncbi:FecR domain-containing protein [Candidatus Peregrinibacteria bacterium]|nr:FecR domain-containing protein [Candidatus Peregrinibacteria bacterium]